VELPPADDWFGDVDEEPSPRPRFGRVPVEPAGRRRPPLDRRIAVRLGAVAAAIVVVAVVIAALAGGSDAAGADRSYLSRLAAPAAASQDAGNQLSQLLASRRLTKAQLDAGLAAALSAEQRASAQAASLEPSPRLRDEQNAMLDALRLRNAGLSDLVTLFHDAEATPTKSTWPTLLSAAADRVLASDVLWHDVFQARVQAQLAHDGVHDGSAPPSTFLSDPKLATPAAMSAVLARLRAPTSPTSPSSSAVLKTGDKGAAVKAWQQELNKWLSRKGLTTITVDGAFGPATADATMRLQQAAGLTADGVVGPATRRALAAALR